MTREGRDETDGLANAPWYVRFAVRVGVPTAFASVLLWFLLSNVTGTLAELRASQLQIVANQAIIIQAQFKVVELIADHDLVAQRTLMMSQALCYNAAVGSVAVDRCTMALR